MSVDHVPGEVPPTREGAPSPAPQLSDDEILRRVDAQMSAAGSSSPPSNSIVFAFGLMLVACVCVGMLVRGRTQPVEAAGTVAVVSAPSTPVPPVSASSVPQWVNWTYSLEEGQARARQNHSKVLIDFYTDWCPDCKWTDSAVYTRPDVLAESQNVAMVKINAEGRRDLALRYQIRAYPTFVWTDENGTVTARQEGNTGAAQFAALMAQNR